jgi:eukaryotic-like serine/threonine-protein kinase
MGAMALSDSDSVGPATSGSDMFDGTPYRTVRRLGSGGMSNVFIVTHRELEKEFVAKVLREELAGDEQTLDRVRIEAQSLGRLSHENVVSVSDVRHLRDGRPFIVMEHLRGRSLAAELSSRRRLPVSEATRFAGELLSALSAVHALGIVHRDIKPSNLFICDLPGGRRTLKVIDFGVARVLPGAPPSAPPPLSVPTATGAVVGTPRYLSPEGAAGEHVDHRADLYAAALVLYTMIAGRGPFDHVKASELLSAKEMADPQPPSHFAGDSVPPELDSLLLKALRRSPEERFQSADDFNKVLRAAERTRGGVSGEPETRVNDGERPKIERLEAYDTTLAAESGAATDRPHSEDEIVTRTADPRAYPKSTSIERGLSPAAKHLAVAAAFLLITMLTFAIGIGAVRLVQAYLVKG